MGLLEHVSFNEELKGAGIETFEPLVFLGMYPLMRN